MKLPVFANFSLRLRGLRPCLAGGLASFACALGAVFFSGCASETPKYETFIFYETANAPGASLGTGFSHEITLPAFPNRTFTVLNKPHFSDLHIADVVAVRATPVMSSEGQPAYDIRNIPPPSAVASKSPPPAAPAPPATATAAPAATTPPAAAADIPDLDIPALLLRLSPTPAATQRFLSDSMNPHLLGRRVFLVVNGTPVGTYLITGPVRDGRILFNHQLMDIPPEHIDEALYDLARDINRSIVIRKKEAGVQ